MFEKIPDEVHRDNMQSIIYRLNLDPITNDSIRALSKALSAGTGGVTITIEDLGVILRGIQYP